MNSSQSWVKLQNDNGRCIPRWIYFFRSNPCYALDPHPHHSQIGCESSRQGREGALGEADEGIVRDALQLVVLSEPDTPPAARATGDGGIACNGNRAHDRWHATEGPNHSHGIPAFTGKPRKCLIYTTKIGKITFLLNRRAIFPPGKQGVSFVADFFRLKNEVSNLGADGVERNEETPVERRPDVDVTLELS